MSCVEKSENGVTVDVGVYSVRNTDKHSSIPLLTRTYLNGISTGLLGPFLEGGQVEWECPVGITDSISVRFRAMEAQDVVDHALCCWALLFL